MFVATDISWKFLFVRKYSDMVAEILHKSPLSVFI